MSNILAPGHTFEENTWPSKGPYTTQAVHDALVKASNLLDNLSFLFGHRFSVGIRNTNRGIFGKRSSLGWSLKLVEYSVVNGPETIPLATRSAKADNFIAAVQDLLQRPTHDEMCDAVREAMNTNAEALLPGVLKGFADRGATLYDLNQIFADYMIEYYTVRASRFRAKSDADGFVNYDINDSMFLQETP